MQHRLDSYLDQQDQAQRDWEAEPADRLDYLVDALQQYEQLHPSPLPLTLSLDSTGLITLWEGSRPALNENDEPHSWPNAWDAVAFLKQ